MPEIEQPATNPTTDRSESPKAEHGARRIDRLTRRGLLQRTGAAAAASGTVAISAAAIAAQQDPGATPQAVDLESIPPRPDERPPESLSYLDPDQAALVEAIAARIIPGDEDDPGAREAGVIYYIDRMLAHSEGFPQPTYRQPPFAMTYSGDEPPADNGQQSGVPVIWVAEDQLERYGFQSMLTPREIYAGGITGTNRLAQREFDGAGFVDLNGDQQDELVAMLESGDAGEFDGVPSTQFFELIRQHTMEGMFADPIYGGNRNLTSWIMLGYPGAQRAYSAEEMKTEGTDRESQGLDMLPVFRDSRPEDDAVHPVRGTDDHHHQIVTGEEDENE